MGNGFDVATLSNVHAYCWDSFSEEVAGGMGVINTFSSDFPYQEGTKPMLLSGFGMTEGGIPKNEGVGMKRLKMKTTFSNPWDWRWKNQW